MAGVLFNLQMGLLSMPIDPQAIQWDAAPQTVGQPVTGAVDKPLRGGVIFTDTSKVAAEQRAASGEARAQAGQAMEAERLRMAQQAAAREQTKFEQEATGVGGKPTEAQQKTLTLLTRIAGGARDIQNVLAADQEAQAPGLAETVARGVLGEGVVSRKIAGADRRIVTDAQRDVLDALLTLGTGAAYSKEQLEAQTLSYFPQYGDTPDEIRVKNERLGRLVETARIATGPLAQKFDESIAPMMAQAAQRAPAATQPQQSSPSIMQPLAAGVGDIVEAGGDILGIVGNPLNATINQLAGTNLSTDLGATLRQATGLPQGNETISAINQAAAGGLLGAGAARGGAQLATGAAREALAAMGSTPLVDMAAGAGGGLAQQAAAQMGAGPVAQTAAALAGGTAAGMGAARIGGATGAMAPGAIARAQETQVDNQSISQLQAMFDNGANADELKAAAAQYNLSLPDQYLMPAVQYRDAGGKGATVMPPAGAAAEPAIASAATTGEGTGRTYQAGERIGGGAGGAMSVDEQTIRAERARELPVPVELARFQRSRLFEEQQRARELAKNNEVGGPIRQRLSEQQDALRQNFDKFIDATGSEVWENAREKGVVVDEALRKLANVGKTRVRVLYKRAEQAGETQEPVEYRAVNDFIDAQTPTTREQLAPVLKAVQEQLAKNDPNGTGAIPINALEDVRKLINRVAQEGTPNAAYGREIKGIIDGLTEGKGGELYQAARRARIDYANTFENAGLVKQLIGTKPGTVDRQVALENVAEKAIYSRSTSLDDIRNLKGVLDQASGRGERAWRELQGATLEYIRDQAYKGITRDESGKVVISPAALNKAISQLDASGKLDFVFGNKTAELLRTINSVAQDVFTAPPGSVNTSGTSSALMNAMDTLGTWGTTGLPIPAVKILQTLRQSLKNRELRKEVTRLLD